MTSAYNARASHREDLFSVSLEKYESDCWALSNDLMVSAREILLEIPKKKGKGRPPLTRCREDLIKRIYGHYPKELRKKSYESNFEKTVKMILDWVEPSPPTDIHAAIIRALGCKNNFQ